MDRVVHSKTDEQDGNDLGDLIQITDHTEMIRPEQHTEALHPHDCRHDHGQGERNIGDRTPNRSPSCTPPARPHVIHVPENQQDDQERTQEEATDLGREVELVSHEQQHAECLNVDATGRVLLCRGRDPLFDIDECTEVVTRLGQGRSVEKHDDEPGGSCGLIKPALRGGQGSQVVGLSRRRLLQAQFVQLLHLLVGELANVHALHLRCPKYSSKV
ncbi:hypothetical protein BMS3Bbin01_00555 [bacterium BMS3Bbin01]|nr:hypothetical protein BMS3Bbin01_00555 [bacterium BMS3Bbin01]